MGDFFKFPYKILIQLGSKPSYRELLETVEWGVFRQRILDRDKKCVKCNVSVEGGEQGYYRKPTPAEILLQEKEWANDPGIDLLGDGTHFAKGQKLKILGIRLVMQVHHKYYIKDKLPWEYDDTALISVCKDCHVKIHTDEDILMYTDDTLTTFKKVESCATCSGTGYRSQFDYYKNGICFYCDGRGFSDAIISTQ